MSYTLRPYQAAALQSLWSWFERHDTGNPIMSLVVGSGKSLLIAEVCKHALTVAPGTRVLMLVASKELCEQNLQKLLAIWPDAPAGVHSASLGRKDLGHDILYCTIGSVARKAHLLGKVDVVLVDECHGIANQAVGMYRRLIAELQVFNPAMRVIGWTGTPYRGDGVWLTDADEPIFHGVAARVTMRELLDQGFLSPLVTKATTTRLDASGVAMRGGDFVISELARAIDKQELVDSAVEEIIRLAEDRRRWLVYCVTIEHAERVSRALQQRGILAEVVSSKTPADYRAGTIARFRRGDIDCIVNVACLTTGFDVPEVDLIALLRNTRSPVLYTQICGRGMRIAPGKEDCLWLDFTDTTIELGPVDQVTGRCRPAGKGPSVAPLRTCDNCGEKCAVSFKECPTCGHAFPEPEVVNHGDRASNADILSRQSSTPPIETVPIDEVTYSRYRKQGKPDTFCAAYWSGIERVARVWLAFGAPGFAGEVARKWWKKCSEDGSPIPGSVNEALQMTGCLRTPSAIVVVNGKYTEVVGYEFEGTAVAA